ncbi:mitogen-activated protein kinase kinase kinase 4 isoform X2 [Neocloeon triangulifer]|uniref:mitogen-activated protein kinase kinase kinase 4 isoform X2 n=1 Tax=Neocloeon triangulifer TaxID=2078957 RepID=UPI00286F57CE|nr:mitogen-activated protein kinase kinase kinase 4 isoform X2 [Neocloeon triangulifer]
MADQDWKRRVGVEINITSSSEDDETDGKGVPINRRNKQHHQSRQLAAFSPPENESEEFSLSGEYYPELDMGRTPPRTKILRNLKDKRNRAPEFGDSRASRAGGSRSGSKNRRKSVAECSPAKDHSDPQENEFSEGRQRVRKRSMKLLRESEREWKLDMGGQSSSNVFSIGSVINEERADSMPAPAVKIETVNRFMSLASKVVKCDRENKIMDTFARLNLDKPISSDTQCPQNRIDFHNTFSLLIRMGNPDRNQDKNNCRRQLSKEETLWQSELKDMIWLELQAFLADKSLPEQDMYLFEERKNVANLLEEIANYKFCATANQRDKDSVDSGTELVAAECNCLSMFCNVCCRNQNLAIEQVENLLSRLEEAVALYPSSRVMAAEYPLYKSKEFTNKLKALCLWYNMIRLHRLKVSIIGKLLNQMNQRSHRSRSGNWPRLEEDSGASVSTTPSTGSVASADPFKMPDAPDLKPKETKVKFRLHDLEIETTTSPSDSNSSNASTGLGLPFHGTGNESAISSSSSRGSISGIDRCCDTSHLKDGTGHVAPCAMSPYRAYIEEVLKTHGLKRAIGYLDSLHLHLLSKAKITLDKATIPLEDATEEEMQTEDWELKRFGLWSPEAQSMCLPSYKSAFLFLARIALDLIHEYLRLRLEQKPSEPSALSIRQLMREMKDGLHEGVKQRQRYMHLLRSATWTETQEVTDRLEQDVADFDRSMKCILEVYLEYLQQWVLIVQKESVVVCPYQKSLLEEEWKFVKHTCPFIPGGEALAANSFCRMASGMLSAIVDHLNAGVDDLSSILEDSNVDNDLQDDQSSGADEAFDHKQSILSACRNIQNIFHEARERALRAISFAKTLRKDLEIASSFSLMAPLNEFLLRLSQADHVRVVAPHSCSHLMFVPASLKTKPELVCRLVNMNLTSASCGSNLDPADMQNPHYLVLVQCLEEDVTWPGETISIQPTAETTITLSHVEVHGVLLVVCDSTQLCRHRRHLVSVLGSTVALAQESLPSNYTIADSLEELKMDAVNLRRCVTTSIQSVEKSCDVRNMTDVDEQDRMALISKIREILHQCYKFGFEYNKEVCRLVTGEAKSKQAKGMVEFAKQWMRFVRGWCERGRGLRPRWANQGLEFLITACEPEKTKYLADEEFEELKLQIDDCITHVIGSASDKSPRNSLIECRSRGTSPSPLGRKQFRSSRSMPENSGTPELLDSPLPMRKRMESVPNGLDGHVVETLRIPLRRYAKWSDRVKDAVEQLDKRLEEKLHDQELIGKRTEIHSPDQVHIKARAVTFSWQRGIKIGQGRFGKVYTAVNNATGELMAMKEISFQPNDHKAIRKIAEELHIFEGIQHKHLIRYYGVEIHREEMLIFMEYCEEGTLESLVAATTNGLPEQLVRSYTRQLLLAVSTLHFNGIVHRDIKSANIFLTDEGNCLKLGDFGSAVKIRANTTMPGELQGFVGTQAYMAPEVFMKTNTEGHGRAADIWSVGCVVIEMASGKRPWPEYESNYQIMFKVGMGDTPKVPDSLSIEGHSFVDLCLQHDPHKRASADELLEHTFVKYDMDDPDLEDTISYQSGSSSASKFFLDPHFSSSGTLVDRGVYN